MPGPHTGSLSGQCSDTPRHSNKDIERNDDAEMLADRDFVLSTTNWTGKPVTDGVCVGVGDCDAEVVAEAGLGEEDAVGVCDCEVLDAQVTFTALRDTPRYGETGSQLLKSKLMKLPFTSATPLAGKWSEKELDTLHHRTEETDENTTAYWEPNMPLVSGNRPLRASVT